VERDRPGLERRVDGTRVVTGLWPSLAQVAAILLGSAAVGYALTGAFLPPAAPRPERAAWGIALGLSLLAGSVLLAFATGLPPVLAIILASALSLSTAALFRRGGGWAVRSLPPTLESAATEGRVLSRSERPAGVRAVARPMHIFLALLAAFGLIVFSLRALAEPPWSNDFLAIWGLKGKVLFAGAGIPRRLFTDPSLGFSHPEYPLGLPLLYASVSFLLGRWDDHALAVLFPFLQAATLLALFGWLRRRGASVALALAAAALLAQFEPLYSAFHTGLAEIPFSFAALLFGAAFSDALDGTDRLAVRRLALAAFLAVSIKNEGLLLIAAAATLALFASRSASAALRSALAALLVPAVLLTGIGRIWKGSLPLRDFDFSYLTTRIHELPPRIGEAIRTAFSEIVLPAWPGLLCLGALIAAGRSKPSGNRLLALALISALAYLLVPSLAVAGPEGLVRTSFARTVSALAPLTAAAIAIRLTEPRAES
jgi:hypothetical protein